MMDKYKVGNFIYQCRIEKGLTQKELSLLLGVTNKAVSKWENGDNKPKVSMLYKLAGVLGVTVDEIVNASRSEENTDGYFFKSQLEELKQRRRKLELIYLILVIALPITAFLFSYFIPIIYCKIFNISLNSSYNQDILSVALIISGILFVFINMTYIFQKHLTTLNSLVQSIMLALFPIAIIFFIILSIISFPLLYVLSIIDLTKKDI